MDEKAKNFFAKKNIPFQDIIYFVRKNHKTELHLTNGNTIITYLPIKVLLSVIPEGIFLSINKGIVVGKAHITHILNNVYTMVDGASFVGRVRTPGRHLLNKYELMSNPELSKASKIKADKSHLAGQFNILEDLPLPFTVVELVFDQEGRGMDFIFRYCNKEMLSMFGLTEDGIINRSLYEVFKYADKKWMVTYADVAMNGTSRIFTTFSYILQTNISVYCYQPAPNFCAYAIVKG